MGAVVWALNGAGSGQSARRQTRADKEAIIHHIATLTASAAKRAQVKK
jgi:hypothetical protein